MSADLVTLTIDGTEVTVPKGTLIIRAAEQVGVEVPRFCDHPYLAPAGACRNDHAPYCAPSAFASAAGLASIPITETGRSGPTISRATMARE